VFKPKTPTPNRENGKKKRSEEKKTDSVDVVKLGWGKKKIKSESRRKAGGAVRGDERPKKIVRGQTRKRKKMTGRKAHNIRYQGINRRVHLDRFPIRERQRRDLWEKHKVREGVARGNWNRVVENEKQKTRANHQMKKRATKHTPGQTTDSSGREERKEQRKGQFSKQVPWR